MKRFFTVALAAAMALGLAAPSLAAQKAKSEEMVVKSTKVERDISQVTDSVSLISEEDLKFGNYTDFSEALRATPGVQFKRNGGPGQFSYPKLRGFGAGHFLVVVDGMKVNDGYFPGVGNLFSQIEPFIVGNAEVLRGPQSVLYGSDTTAGVFALNTKAGVPGTNFTIGGEYGSLDWKKGYTGLRGQEGGFNYSLNLAYTDSNGVIDDDSYTNLTPQIKLGYDVSDVFSISASYFHAKTKQNYSQLNEDYGFNQSRSTWWAFQTPDPDNYNETNYELGAVNLKHQINSSLSQKLTLGWYKKDNETLDKNNGLLGYITAPKDNFTLDWMNYYSKGQTVPVYDDGTGVASHTVNENYMADYNFVWDAALPGNAGGNTLLLGLEYYHQEGKSWGGFGDTKGDFATTSFYANDQLALLQDRLILNGGIRFDNHEEFGSHFVGKGGAAYTFSSLTTLFANAGNTFRAPSVYQLYNAQYGDKDLEPEEGWTVEGGLRQDLCDKKLHFEVTFWHTELDKVIDFEYYSAWQGRYKNADEAKSAGVEFSLRWQALANLAFLINYTYTDSESYDDGEWKRTVQIARNTANIGVRYTFMDRLDLMANAYYVGPRLRWRGDIEMDEYVRVDLTANYQIYKGLSIYGRIQNLFDEKIEEGLGFEEPGFYGIIGVRWDFDFASLGK